MSRLKDNSLIQKLLALELPADDYVVFGSGPMMAHGLRESRDLDLLARGAAWKKAVELGELRHKPEGTGYVVLADGDIEVFEAWGPGQWDTDKVIDTAEIIEGIRFADLKYTLDWKRRMGREKDLTDARLIEEHLVQSRPSDAA
jgi:hypothetical protein